MINRPRFGVKKKECLSVKAPEGWPAGHAPLRRRFLCYLRIRAYYLIKKMKLPFA